MTTVTTEPLDLEAAIYKILPKNNCRLCGQPSCRHFAKRVARGWQQAVDCQKLGLESREKIETLLADQSH